MLSENQTLVFDNDLALAALNGATLLVFGDSVTTCLI